MNIENYENLLKRGPRTNHLVKLSGIVAFPMNFNASVSLKNNQYVFEEFSFSIECLLNCEQLNRISFTYNKKHGYHYETSPDIYCTSESLYEYGNEEEYLPDIEHFISVWSKEEFVSYINMNIDNFFNSYQTKNINIAANDVKSAFLKEWQRCSDIANGLIVIEELDIQDSLKSLFSTFETYKQYNEAIEKKIQDLSI